MRLVALDRQRHVERLVRRRLVVSVRIESALPCAARYRAAESSAAARASFDCAAPHRRCSSWAVAERHLRPDAERELLQRVAPTCASGRFDAGAPPAPARPRSPWSSAKNTIDTSVSTSGTRFSSVSPELGELRPPARLARHARSADLRRAMATSAGRRRAVRRARTCPECNVRELPPIAVAPARGRRCRTARRPRESRARRCSADTAGGCCVISACSVSSDAASSPVISGGIRRSPSAPRPALVGLTARRGAG